MVFLTSAVLGEMVRREHRDEALGECALGSSLLIALNAIGTVEMERDLEKSFNRPPSGPVTMHVVGFRRLKLSSRKSLAVVS